MGLGGTAQGATTVVAILVGIVALLLALGIFAVVRWLSGSWRWALLPTLGFLALVAYVPISDHFSRLNVEARRTAALRNGIVHDLGAQVSTVYDSSTTCEPTGSSRPLNGSIALPRPNSWVPDTQRVLQARGFTTSTGVVAAYGGPKTWVLGLRGRASVLVESAYQNEVDLAVEDGCTQYEAPRPVS